MTLVWSFNVSSLSPVTWAFSSPRCRSPAMRSPLLL